MTTKLMLATLVRDNTVTALYEIVPTGGKGNIDPLRYGNENAKLDTIKRAHIKMNWHSKTALQAARRKQEPVIEVAIEKPSAAKPAIDITRADPEFRFATAVAAWDTMVAR